MTMYRGWSRLLVVAGVLTGLAGCSILPASEPQTVYTLPYELAKTTTASPASPSSRSLRVLTPYSNRMVGSARILVSPEQGEVQAYKGVRWSAPVPQMLRDRLVEALRTDGRLGAVSNDSMHLASDLELGGDLTVFQVEYANGMPTVHIQLDAFLVRPSGAMIVASQRFQARQPANGQDVPDVVKAFGAAADALAQEIVAWTVQHGLHEVKGH